MKNEERKYAYWLCSIPGIGNKTIRKLLEACGGNARRVYQAGEKAWEKVLRGRQWEAMKLVTQKGEWEEEYERLGDKQIDFYSLADEEYPERLQNIPDPPYGIFVKGRLPEDKVVSVAIIGARDCSEYGKYVANELGRFLGEKGVQIISGMARGIDGISQKAALEAGGISFGVLGCGVDVCYPAGNRKLYDRLIEQGGVLSTYLPGTMPNARLFPPRNRIVSGLADVVVVIEAREMSGTLITVDMALEQGKDVFVVPGRITDRLSDGCNKMIRQGAGVILSPEDFWEELEITGKTLCKTETEKRVPLMQMKVLPELQEIYNVLDFYPLSLEQIMGKLPDSYSRIQVNTALLRLCVEKIAQQISPGFFCRMAEQNSILFGGNPL